MDHRFVNVCILGRGEGFVQEGSDVFMYEMEWEVVVLEEGCEKVKFHVDSAPVRANVIASVK